MSRDKCSSQNEKRVVFISMPFASLDIPSIGLSLLKPALESAGHKVCILYFNLDFARIVGMDAYKTIDEHAGIGPFAGDWIFSQELFDSHSNWNEYRENILRAQHPDQGIKSSELEIQCIYNSWKAVPNFLNACAEYVLSMKPDVVGFTSLFQQHTSSLALAKRIKRKRSNVKIFMGGPNCDGITGKETIQSFNFIDAVVSGEADEIIIDLVERLSDGKEISGMPGILDSKQYHLNQERQHHNSGNSIGDIHSQYTRRVTDMDSLPYPDYSDYFHSLEAVGIQHEVTPLVPFETSRGCWWGEKNHCVFCGINPNAMVYRSKSADRVITELKYLSTTYPNSKLLAVDNILSNQHVKELLPKMADTSLSLDIFYEIKSNLRDEQVNKLRLAGIKSVQPGIESLNTDVLKLMNKGSTGIQNIQLLKSCEKYGVSVYWNFLWGFPGELDESYEQMIQFIPSLHHLPAPGMGSKILLNRFSPHYDNPEKYGLVNIRPFPAYRYIYPLKDNTRINHLSYYFCYDYAEGLRSSFDYSRMQRTVSTWQNEYPESSFFYQLRENGTVSICLSNKPEPNVIYAELNHRASYLIKACDQITSLHNLRTKINRDWPSLSLRDFDYELDKLVECGYLFREKDRFLTLAIDFDQYNIREDDTNYKHRYRKKQRALNHFFTNRSRRNNI